MITDRILMILQAHDASDALDTIESACAGAVFRKRLSFGLILDSKPDPSAIGRLAACGNVSWLCGGDTPYTSLWQGEPLIFSADPGVIFLPRWDLNTRRMYADLVRLGIPHPVLTGLPPLKESAVDAFSPVGIDSIGAGRKLTFRRGISFLRGTEPLRAAFAVPGFCCASSVLFRLHDEQQNDTLTMTVIRNAYDCYTPHLLLARSDSDLLPAPLILPSDGMERFEKRFGINASEGIFNSQAHTGCFTPDLSWPQKNSLSGKLRRFSPYALKSAASDRSLLCVTALLDSRSDTDPARDEASVAFRYLAALNNLALLCYTDTNYVETARLKHPNVLEFREEYGLPVRYRPGSEQYSTFLRLSHPFLLAKTAERFPGHTHFAWIDPDCVPYPADPDTVPDLCPFCTDRIVLGTENGVPDLSVILIPAQLLSALCGEICLICGTDSRFVYLLPDETELWNRLIAEHPDRFTLVPVTEKHGLMAMLLHVGNPGRKPICSK